LKNTGTESKKSIKWNLTIYREFSQSNISNKTWENEEQHLTLLGFAGNDKKKKKKKGILMAFSKGKEGIFTSKKLPAPLAAADLIRVRPTNKALLGL
jgi:hypothetical protein